MPLTALEAELRSKIRALMESGELPREVPAQLWGGYGSEALCSACGKSIGSKDLEFEYENGTKTLRFHRLCHGLWQLECERAAALAKAKSAATP
jgi:hypothetical protein